MSFKTIKSIVAFTAVFSALCLFSSCGKDPVAVEPDPVFLATSLPVTLGGGVPGIQFYATPDMDVKMTKVTVKTPLNTVAAEYNLGNSLYVKSVPFGCQDANTGYTKAGGNWTLVFVGKINTNDKNFTIEVILPIAGK